MSQPQNKKKFEIAIIGVGCRLPGGINSLDDLWNALSEQKNLVTEVPSDRFTQEPYLHDEREHKGTSVTFKCGTVGDIKSFDGAFLICLLKKWQHLIRNKELL